MSISHQRVGSRVTVGRLRDAAQRTSVALVAPAER